MSSVSFDNNSNNQDFELNIASIIDCFTVLIAFMLASAAFVSVGILDAGIAAGAATASDATPPPIQITIELKKNQTMTLKVTGKAQQNTDITSKNGEWDYPGLNQHLASLKSKWSTVDAVTLTADNDTEYKHVVRSMESIRKTMPIVLLGGF